MKKIQKKNLLKILNNKFLKSLMGCGNCNGKEKDCDLPREINNKKEDDSNSKEKQKP